MKHLESLRTQLRRDIAVPPSLLSDKLAEANNLIQALALNNGTVPEATPVLRTLAQAVKAFYSDDTHRGWAQQFALQDIQKLHDLYSGGDGPR